MALVEFVDGSGREWRAWNITPEDMHPVTAREMFVGEAADFQEGWLVFESSGERRRLAHYPHNWSNFSPEALETLLRRALPVATRSQPEPGARPATGELRRYESAAAPAVPAVPAAPVAPVARTPKRREVDRVPKPRQERSR